MTIFLKTVRILALKTIMVTPETSCNLICWTERKLTKAVEVKL